MTSASASAFSSSNRRKDKRHGRSTEPPLETSAVARILQPARQVDHVRQVGCPPSPVLPPRPRDLHCPRYPTGSWRARLARRGTLVEGLRLRHPFTVLLCPGARVRLAAGLVLGLHLRRTRAL